MRSRAGTVTKNTLWSALDLALDFALPVFTSILVARAMGPSKLGEYTYILWITQMALVLGSLGVPRAVARYLAGHLAKGEEDEANAVLKLALWVQGASVCVILALGATWALYVLPREETTYALIAVSSLFPASLMGIATAINSAREDFGANVTASIGAMITQATGILLTLHFGWDLTGLAASLFFARTVDCVLRWGLLLARRPSGSRFLRFGGAPLAAQKRSEVLQFCAQASVLLLLNLVVWNRSEMFFLERFCDLTQVAFFSLAFTFANIPAQLAGPFSRAAVASLYVEHGRSRSGAQQIAALTTRYIALVVFPAAVGLAAISGPLVRVLYGSQYAAAAPVLALAGLLGLAAPLAEPATSLATVSGGQRFLVRWGIVAAVSTLTLDLWLVRWHCAMGGAVANGLGQIISALGMWVIATRGFGFRPPFSFTRSVALAAGLMGGVAVGAGLLLPDVARLIVVPPIGVLTFTLLIKRAGILGSEDARRLRSAIKVLPAATRALAERFVSWLIVEQQTQTSAGSRPE